MSNSIRVCAICGVSIMGAHFNATMCSAQCRRVDKTRGEYERRAVHYVKRNCGWCDGSLEGKSQQARFCSTSCMDRNRYKTYREKRLAAVVAYSKTEAGLHVSREKKRKKRANLRAGLVIPFTSAQLAARMAMFSGCWMCGGAWDTVDHVKPIAKGGAHILANLRPACRSCNSSKNAHWEGVRDVLERAAT